MRKTMRNYDIYQRKEKLKRCVSWAVMEECLPDDLVLEYKEAFKILDRKKAGKISIRDVSTMVCSIGIRLTDNELLEFVSRVVELNKLDLTENCVTFPQFLATMTSIITNCVPEEEAARIFQEFDRDGDGYISANELRDLLSQLGDEVSDIEIQEMIEEADMDGDGLVSLQEFINVLNSAHSCPNNNSVEQYSLPRILTDNHEEYLAMSPIPLPTSCSSTCPNQDSDEDTDIPCQSCQDTDVHSESEQNFSPKRKTSTHKRRKSIIDWIKGSPKDCEQCKYQDFDLGNDFHTSSTSSVASDDVAPVVIPPHLRQRRRSSITKTLKNGKDAIFATARTLRKRSR